MDYLRSYMHAYTFYFGLKKKEKKRKKTYGDRLGVGWLVGCFED